MYKATIKITTINLTLVLVLGGIPVDHPRPKNGGITENENMMKDCAHSYLCIPAKCAAVGS